MVYGAVVEKSEFQLIENARDGDDKAFSQLMELHMDKVYAVALRIVRNPAEAEDVSQEVFINVYQKLDSFRGDSAFSTWLYRVTVNQALRHLKRLGKWVPFNDPAQLERIKDTNPSPETAVMEREKREQLREVMSGLPDKQRTVLSLRVEHSLPFKEIAKIVGRSIGGVKANYFHAVRKVQAAFNGGK